MMKRVVLVMTMLFLDAISAQASDTSVISSRVVVGRVSDMEGQVKASAPNGQSRALNVDSEIFLNDRIVTVSKSKVMITLSDESEMSQGENAEMVIDQYVYMTGGGKKDDNCAVNLVQGVFRVITGKIVQLNPERFKVKTKMATIGIRGCDLGFRISVDDEDAYVFDLPAGHSVEIEQTVGADPGIPAKQRLTIQNSGQVVSIVRNKVLKARPFSVDERKRFLDNALPVRALERFRRMEMERKEKDVPRDRVMSNRQGDNNKDIPKERRKPAVIRKRPGK